MNKFKIFSLIAFLILSIATVSAQDDQAAVAITLERTPCFGACPVYTVSILEDGTVIYNGENFVDVEGEQISQIDPETVEMMVQAFADAGYFEWDEAYDEQTISDLPTVITSVTRDGETHRIVRYTGDTAPLALPFLEQWIDLMANTGMWVGVQANSAIFNGETSPVITLQQTACFGFCPVYNLALYADGTAVYTGIANVDKLGVTVYQLETWQVDSVIQRAKAFGYFTWKDSYEDYIMTDQVTVISSIQTEDDGYKQITRYDGDPNAPIGLVRIEESIAELAPQD